MHFTHVATNSLTTISSRFCLTLLIAFRHIVISTGTLKMCHTIGHCAWSGFFALSALAELELASLCNYNKRNCIYCYRRRTIFLTSRSSVFKEEAALVSVITRKRLAKLAKSVFLAIMLFVGRKVKTVVVYNWEQGRRQG